MGEVQVSLMDYVMSDIHGQYAAYLTMLKTINLAPADTLYIIGDAIDRGKHGIKILQHIMEQDNVILLRGNHEQTMLEAEHDTRIKSHWLVRLGGKPTNDKFQNALTTEEQQIIWRFLTETPIELEIEVEGIEYHLIHGRPSREEVSKLWDRFLDWEVPIYNTNKFIVFGHTPTILYQSSKPMQIFFSDSGLIGIDCGCAYGKAPGRLGCLRLNDWKEFYVDI
jgi:serine/threonine protein phosphatase 1